MKKTLLMLTLCTFLYNAANAQKDSEQLSAAFDQLMEGQFKANETGAAALISKNGKIIYKKAFGMANLELNVPMQADNVFRIGSITKQFTAIAILQLMEEGKLNLQDEITKFIPDYPTQGHKITIEHLLTHTSGIQNFNAIKDNEKRATIDYTPKEIIDYFKNEPMRFPPGTKWEYSNSGYFLLGYIIEHITGKTYAQYLDEKFFKPLGMSNSSYANESRIIPNRAAGYTREGKDIRNAGYFSMTQPYAAGAVLSTVEDLFKWNQAVQSYKLVKKTTLDKAFTRSKLKDGTETNYGYGWRLGTIQESPSLWHGGLISGFTSTSIYLPKEDVFIAVFSNCDCKSPENITAKLATLAIGKSYEHKAITLNEKILEMYTGEYEIKPGFTFLISKEQDRLFLQATGQEKVEIFAESENKFFLKVNGAQLEFVKDNSGSIIKAILTQGTRQTDARKIK